MPQSENELSAAKQPDRYYNEIHYPYELMATSTTTTYRVLLKKLQGQRPQNTPLSSAPLLLLLPDRLCKDNEINFLPII